MVVRPCASAVMFGYCSPQREYDTAFKQPSLNAGLFVFVASLFVYLSLSPFAVKQQQSNQLKYMVYFKMFRHAADLSQKRYTVSY